MGLLSSNDPQDLADKILQFIDNPDMSYEHSVREINLLKKKYNVKETGKKLIKCIQNII